MIANERQYQQTRKMLGELEHLLASTSAGTAGDDGFRDLQAAGLRSQVEDLRDELDEYEQLRDGTTRTIRAGSLAELADALIKARGRSRLDPSRSWCRSRRRRTADPAVRSQPLRRCQPRPPVRHRRRPSRHRRRDAHPPSQLTGRPDRADRRIWSSRTTITAGPGQGRVAHAWLMTVQNTSHSSWVKSSITESSRGGKGRPSARCSSRELRRGSWSSSVGWADMAAHEGRRILAPRPSSLSRSGYWHRSCAGTVAAGGWHGGPAAQRPGRTTA